MKTRERLEKINAEDGAGRTTTVGTEGLGVVQAMVEDKEEGLVPAGEVTGTTTGEQLGVKKEGEGADQHGIGAEAEAGATEQGEVMETRDTEGRLEETTSPEEPMETDLGHQEDDKHRLHQANKSEYHLHPLGHRTKICNQPPAGERRISMDI
jgi:hypothetical protein